MPGSIYARTKGEERIADALRSACLEAMKGCNEDEICRRLGFKWSALRRLVAEPSWDLRIAVRTADHLGLSVVEQLAQLSEQAASSALQQVS